MHLDNRQIKEVSSLMSYVWEKEHENRFFKISEDFLRSYFASDSSSSGMRYEDENLVSYVGGMPMKLTFSSGVTFPPLLMTLWTTHPDHVRTNGSLQILKQSQADLHKKNVPGYISFFKENSISHRLYKLFSKKLDGKVYEYPPIPIFQYHKSHDLAELNPDVSLRTLGVDDYALAACCNELPDDDVVKRTFNESEILAELSGSLPFQKVKWFGVFLKGKPIGVFRTWEFPMGSESEPSLVISNCSIMGEDKNQTLAAVAMTHHASHNNFLRVLALNPTYFDLQRLKEAGFSNTYAKYVPFIVLFDGYPEYESCLESVNKVCCEII